MVTTMKYAMPIKCMLLVFSLGSFFYSHGQLNNRHIELFFIKKLPEISHGDGRWEYQMGSQIPQKLEMPMMKSLLPLYDIYPVRLTNYLGWHISEGTCVILYDSINSKLVLVEPLWYKGISEPLIKLILHKPFYSKDSLLSFMNELNQVMEIGSKYKFKLTGQSDTLLTYDLGYYPGDSIQNTTLRFNKDGVWRKVVIEMKEWKIIRFREINPVTKNERMIE